MTNMKRASAVTAFVASAALLLAACSNGDDPATDTTNGDDTEVTDNTETPDDGPKDPVELTWWHNGVAGDSGENAMGDFWDAAAQQYMDENDHVTITIEAIQNEDLQRTRIPTALQAGNAPDIFQQWGGGELADQANAGYLMDLSGMIAEDIERLGGAVGPWQYDGATYGIPYQFAVEGVWYRKSLFDQAGITEEPTTLEEFNSVVQQLKDADIVPVAVGAGDSWPAAHWWYNFALQACSQETIASVGEMDFSDPCYVTAGENLEEFLATDPFQPQATSTAGQEGATSSAGMVANGNAAMELMGQWNFFVYQGFTDGSDEENQALIDDLGWFPMPQVPGGQGDPTAAMGGGDGFSCYVDAPAECADFLAFLVSDEVQADFAEAVGGLPVAPNAAGSVADEVNQKIAEAAGNAAYTQLWLDTDLGQNVGNALNDAVVAIFGGNGDAQGVVNAITAAAATV